MFDSVHCNEVIYVFRIINVEPFYVFLFFNLGYIGSHILSMGLYFFRMIIKHV